MMALTPEERLKAEMARQLKKQEEAMQTWCVFILLLLILILLFLVCIDFCRPFLARPTFSPLPFLTTSLHRSIGEIYSVLY